MNIIKEALYETLSNSCAEAVPGDYTDEKTGLLVCGKCHGFKQHKLTICGEPITVKRCCPCDLESQKKEQERLKKRALHLAIRQLREECIADPAMRDKTFASSRTSSQLEKGKAYVDHWAEMEKHNIGLLFWGPPGSGKTHAVACIANALIDKGIPAGMLSISSLLAMPFEKRDVAIEKMIQMPLLIIDDLNAERKTEYAMETIFNLVDSRVRAGRPMIVTTNIIIDEIEKPTDLPHQRIYERIHSDCPAVKFTETSYRNNHFKEKRSILNGIFAN